MAKAIGAAALAAALVATGCGGSGSSGDGGGTPIGPVTPTDGPYQPLTVGTMWTYHVDDQGVVYDKQSNVEALEDIGGMAAGIMGYRVRETIKSAIQLTWYEVTATDVRRHHDQLTDNTGALASDEWYTPYLLRIDSSPDHLMANAAWTMDYMDTKTTSSKPTSTTNKSQNWHVDAVDMPVAVPAGTFASLKVTFTEKSDGSTKTQWFVKGIGKVREETSLGHTELLTQYMVAPASN
jgi:hypothetical protein